MRKGLRKNQPSVWQKFQNHLTAEVGQILRHLEGARADHRAGTIARPDRDRAVEPARSAAVRPNRDAA